VTLRIAAVSLVAAFLPLPVAGEGRGEGSSSPSPALHIAVGSVAEREVIAIGRDVVVGGEARSHVAAIGGSVRVEGSVAGDVIVLDGDVDLAASSTVGGDVFVVGGTLVAAPEASIGGRSAAYPTAPAVWLTLLEGPALGLSATAPAVLATKLALLAFWALVLLGACAFRGAALRATAREIRGQPFRSFFVGLAGVFALGLTTVFLSAVAAWLVGAPLLLLLLALSLAFKLWGMAAVFAALGGWLLDRLGRRRAVVLHAAGAGLVALGLVKFLPWIGTLGWTLATLIGVGATLITKFGREEPWLVEAA
jgi:hypothetical protein